LDVQTCFAGAPLLLSITKEIFFRMINAPLIQVAEYFTETNVLDSSSHYSDAGQIKTPTGALTQGVT
jgi:hypothetical protein